MPANVSEPVAPSLYAATAEAADELVELRGIRGGFSSADDMLVACGSLNLDRLNMIRDRLIFLPRDIDLDSAWLPPSDGR